MKRFSLILTMAFFVFGFSISQAQNTNKSFVLGPGDILQVSVWKDEALTREILVRPDGSFSFPLAGQIQAAGKTVRKVQEELSERLQKYAPDSPVTVALSKLNSTKIYVVGKVTNPGMYLMQGKMHVMQALAASGGLTRFADADEIIILRDENSTQKVIPFSYSSVSQGEDLESNIVLKSGDTIVVP